MLSRTKRMDNLIEGILEYSRLRRTVSKSEEIDTGPLIQTIIESLEVPDGIEIRCQGPLPIITYDLTKLDQVFQNLISNAVKHLGKPTGSIIISCDEHDDVWSFHVKDTGVGIDARHFERIFKMFQMLKAHDESDSTGIGLSLVKGIVEQNGGTVTVESTVGEGATFSFTVPKTVRPTVETLTPNMGANRYEPQSTHPVGR